MNPAASKKVSKSVVGCRAYSSAEAITIATGPCGLGKMWEQMKETTRNSRIWEAGDGRREY